jgi:hypothetical protein
LYKLGHWKGDNQHSFSKNHLSMFRWHQINRTQSYVSIEADSSGPYMCRYCSQVDGASADALTWQQATLMPEVTQPGMHIHSDFFCALLNFRCVKPTYSADGMAKVER